MKQHTFGINMKQFCRDHETRITTEKTTPELLESHRRMISWVQHERLVHLIVTVMVVICELFVVDLVLLHPDSVGVIGAAVMLGGAVLLGFYFYHYFFLENTVQRWYKIEQEMSAKLCGGSDVSRDRSCVPRRP